MHMKGQQPKSEERAVDSKKQMYGAVKLNKLNKKRRKSFFGEWRDEERKQKRTRTKTTKTCSYYYGPSEHVASERLSFFSLAGDCLFSGALFECGVIS